MIIKQIPEDFIVEEIPLFTNLLDKGDYQIFLLEKKDYDTEKVIQKLSEIFKIHRKFFSYAGNKDRKAITRQYFSIKTNKKINNLERDFFKIKFLGFYNEPISLGCLKGNKFTITIRDLSKKEMDFLLAKLYNKKNSHKNIDFINYFDEQRFSKNNYEIGYSLIKKDFKRASELIDSNEVKKYLTLNKNDYVGAIKKMPFNILTMYINSVQSYLFNEFCAEYIKKKVKSYFEVDYHLGETKKKIIKKFVFTNEKIENIEVPLISFDTSFEKKEITEIYEKILKRENILLSDFVIRQIPDLTAFGSYRDLITSASDINVLDYGVDDLKNNLEKESKIEKKKIKISFTLSKGSYATIFIKFLFSSKDFL
ncbi:MAG: tRNA pseudouridine(13) synthase TruD [Candidatus Woesearchaeota archaeon]